jgi:hypothetical protein
MISTYQTSKLESIDRRLLRGLYQRNLRDFDEDINDFTQNKSLLMRLKSNLIPAGNGADTERLATDSEYQASPPPRRPHQYDRQAESFDSSVNTTISQFPELQHKKTKRARLPKHEVSEVNLSDEEDHKDSMDE